MKWFNKIKYLLALDMRVFDDPFWLTGQKPKEKTQKMIDAAKKRVSLS